MRLFSGVRVAAARFDTRHWRLPSGHATHIALQDARHLPTPPRARARAYLSSDSHCSHISTVHTAHASDRSHCPRAQLGGLDALTKLQVLSVGNNLIQQLDNVMYLRPFAMLQAVNLVGNPFCQDEEYRR